MKESPSATTLSRYLVGEPILRPARRDELFVPYGQAGACLDVFKETSAESEIVTRLREEYLSILSTVEAMDIRTRIVYAHPDLVDRATLAILAERGAKFARFNEGFFPSSVAFPRDFSSVLSGLVLFNEDAQLRLSESEGSSLVSSPFGQGGRLLFSGHVAIVCDRVCRRNGTSESVGNAHVAVFEEHGLTVARCPAPVLVRLDKDGRIVETAVNDHVDRIAALICDARGRLHLIVDPGVVTTRFPDPPGAARELLGPEETARTLRSALDPIGVAVHLAPRFKTPYALNLLQFPDGRILMTGGDPALEEFVESLTGQGTVTTTAVPIRHMPTWLCGGIRCLVSEEPTPVLGPRKR